MRAHQEDNKNNNKNKLGAREEKEDGDDHCVIKIHCVAWIIGEPWEQHQHQHQHAAAGSSSAAVVCRRATNHLRISATKNARTRSARSDGLSTLSA